MQNDSTALLRAAEVGDVLVREITYGAGKRYPSHVHSRAQVTLILGGTLRETACGRDEFATALSVAVKPAGMEHADCVGPRGARTLQIQLGAEGIDATGRSYAFARDWQWLHGDRVSGSFLTLLECLREGSRELKNALYDALACLPEPLPTNSGAVAPRWLQAVREEIDDRYHEPLRVSGLASSVGVHPVYLARQFRRFYGCTVTGHLKRRRVQVAAELIEHTTRPLTRIAHEAGYFDQAHFCHEFRKVVGLAPSAYRLLARHQPVTQISRGLRLYNSSRPDP